MQLTAVTLVCASRDGLSTLVTQINAFIFDPVRVKRCTIERACEHGFLYLLRYLVSEANIDTHMRPQLYRSHVFSRALAHAVAHDNDLALLECLQTYCPDGFASLGMEAAARVGKLSVMQWLDEHFEPHIIRSSRFAMAAASNGHVDVLQWLATKFRPHPDRLCDVVKAAVASDDLTSVQFLFEQVDHDGVVFTTDQHRAILESALTGGHHVIVQYLIVERGIQPLKSANSICKVAVSGNLELMQWLHAHGYRDLDDITIFTAVKHDHIDVVRWATENAPALRGTESRYLNDAALLARLEITQLLYAFKPKLFNVNLLATKLRSAAATGDLLLVQWIFSILTARNWLFEVRLDRVDDALISAASNGHLEIVQLLVAHASARSHNAVGIQEQAVSQAAGNGHVEIVKWLHENRHSDMRPTYNIRYAAEHGYIKLVQWMRENAECETLNHVCMRGAARNGHLVALQWMRTLFDAMPLPEAKLLVILAVRQNHVHIVQWLHEQGYESWDTDAMDNATSLEMVEWLHNNRTEGCTTKVMDNAAARGDFDTLLFLHEHRNEGCTVAAAARAQEKDHQIIVQWLFDTYPHIVTKTGVLEQIRIEKLKMVFWAPQLKRTVPTSDGVKAIVANSKKRPRT